MVDADLSLALALGHGALLLCPLTWALSVEASGANHGKLGVSGLTEPGRLSRIIHYLYHCRRALNVMLNLGSAKSISSSSHTSSQPSASDGASSGSSSGSMQKKAMVQSSSTKSWPPQAPHVPREFWPKNEKFERMCSRLYFFESAFVLHICGWDCWSGSCGLTNNSRNIQHSQTYKYFWLHDVQFLRFPSRMLSKF